MALYADQKASLLAFAEQVPELLLRHRETANLAVRLTELGLADALRTRFTVAIVGQMRAGKSTLLNGLIGRSLAPTGVTETTATVNWFRHDAGPLCGIFRVHWEDGSTSDLPLDRVGEWIGDADHARRTRSLDFFAPSEFLKTCNIVDTPGTRSTIASHEAATQDFLAERLETDSLRHGGRADAVIYAINPVAREDDRELLNLFGERTRLPGVSAYNGIAVVQKWEHLRPDPLAEAQRLCDRLAGQLEGKVAAVLPVSGLLAVTCREAPAWAWDRTARLAAETPADVLDELTTAPAYFLDETEGAALPVPERAELAAALPWPVLSFAVWLARSRALGSGAGLREAVREASGIDRLYTLLQDRFFSLAGLIQAGSVLRKAWDPCASARLMLRGVRDSRLALRELALTCREPLAHAAQTNADLRPALAYLAESLHSVDSEVRLVDSTLEALDSLVHRAERDFRLLERDVECLRQLDGIAADGAGPGDWAALRRLFGGSGPDAHERLGIAPDVARDLALDAAWAAHGASTRRKFQTRGTLNGLYGHAVERLEAIIDHLEADAS